MQNFLIILPISIAGTFIMRGFTAGFKGLGYNVIEKDVREIIPENLNYWQIDTIICYDYGYLHNNKLAEYIIKNRLKYKLIHYFADNPHSVFAHSNDSELYEKLYKINPFIFMWETTYLNLFKNSFYLPLGVNPLLYRTDNLDPSFDISFAGRPLGEKRQKILSLILKRYGKRLKIFSFEKHFINGANQMLNNGLITKDEYEIFKGCYCGFIETEKQLAQVYRESLINLNITIQGENNLNYRIFEVLASKGFLLTDYQNDIEKFFTIRKDLETYRNEDELLNKLDYYLKHKNIARDIAESGSKKVLKEHTFLERAKSIVSIVNCK